MSNLDYRSELEQWAAMWDEMEAEGDFPAVEKPKRSEFAANILGSTAQDTYYDYLDSEEMLQESVPAKKTLKEHKSPNPVYPDSVGKDNENPKPVWVQEDLLKEVESLKKRLFQVENRMARMGQGKNWTEKAVVAGKGDKMESEIKLLRSRIDRVSNTLGIKDEPSPWNVKGN